MSPTRQIPGESAEWEIAIGSSASGAATGRGGVSVLDGPPGWTVRRVAETGSTNDDLVHAARLGAPDRTVLVAGHQTAGRGRLDRRWEAPPGANLLVSVLRHPVGLISSDPGVAARLVALAAVRAAQPFTAGRVSLKWPNDLLLDHRKLGGILAQRASDGSVIVGLGLNVGWAPDGAARLAPDHNPRIDPLQVLDRLLHALDDLGIVGETGHATALAAAYREHLDTIGQQVRVVLPDGELVGRALDVTDDGRLVVLDGCGISHRLDVGDVVNVRPDGDHG